MGLIVEAFGESSDLYSILNLPRSATPPEIKRAYKQAALRHHPDKNGGSESSTLKFKAVSLAHSVLSDLARRAEYDASGHYEEGDLPEQMSAEHWRLYFRRLFPQITVERIEEFQIEYVGSAEEQADVLSAYQRGNGDMDVILECVIFASVNGVDRYVKIIEDAIARGEVGRLPKLAKSLTAAAKQRRKRKQDREAAEAEADKAKQIKKRPSSVASSSSSSLCDLAAQLRGRSGGMSSFANTIANLEEAFTAKKPRRK